jgi:hypothetical protein
MMSAAGTGRGRSRGGGEDGFQYKYYHSGIGDGHHAIATSRSTHNSYFPRGPNPRACHCSQREHRVSRQRSRHSIIKRHILRYCVLTLLGVVARWSFLCHVNENASISTDIHSFFNYHHQQQLTFNPHKKYKQHTNYLHTPIYHLIRSIQTMKQCQTRWR